MVKFIYWLGIFSILVTFLFLMGCAALAPQRPKPIFHDGEKKVEDSQAITPKPSDKEPHVKGKDIKNIYFAPDIGICKTDSESWQSGPSGGVNIFFSPSGKSTSVGGRISYNSVFASGGTGHFSAMEIIPSARVKITEVIYSKPKINRDMYLQLGFGAFVLDSYHESYYSREVPSGGTTQYFYDPDGNYMGEKTEQYYHKESVKSVDSYSGTRPGVQMGVAYIGKYLEICPLFSLIFNEGYKTMRFSINAGFHIIK